MPIEYQKDDFPSIQVSENEPRQPDLLKRWLITYGPPGLVGGVLGWFGRGFFDPEKKGQEQTSPISDPDSYIEKSIQAQLGYRWATAYIAQTAYERTYGTAIFPALYEDLQEIGQTNGGNKLIDLYQQAGWGTNLEPAEKINAALLELDQYQWEEFEQTLKYKRIFRAIALTFPGLIIANPSLILKENRSLSPEDQQFSGIIPELLIPKEDPYYVNDKVKIDVLLTVLAFQFSGDKLTAKRLQLLKPFISFDTLQLFIRAVSQASVESIEVERMVSDSLFKELLTDLDQHGFEGMTADNKRLMIAKIVGTPRYANLDHFVYDGDFNRNNYAYYKTNMVAAMALVQMTNTSGVVDDEPINTTKMVLEKLRQLEDM